MTPRSSLERRVARLEALRARRSVQSSDCFRRDPARVFTDSGLTPDPWQRQVLTSGAARLLLLCSRQAGKSTAAAALALHTALVTPGAPVLLLSPSLRQSAELFRKVVDLYERLGRPVGCAAQSGVRLELANGARVVSLPGDGDTVRGFSNVALVVIDEAARVSDALYAAARPMLAVSRGRLVALSTPFGQRGWFFEAWQGDGDWQRLSVTAAECPRIGPDFLAEERRALGERWYRQEYECRFKEAAGAVFRHEDIEAALSNDVQPWDIGDDP